MRRGVPMRSKVNVKGIQMSKMLRLYALASAILMLALWVCPVRGNAQAIDIKLGTIGPYSDLARSAIWGSTGRGNTDNSYIFVPQNTNSLTCVYVANNNPTNAHALTLTFR